MFTQTFVDETGKTKKPLTLVFSLLLQLILLFLLILIPLVYTQTLPGAQLKGFLTAPAPPPAAPPKPPATHTQTNKMVRVLNTRQFFAPAAIPKQVNRISDASPAPDIGVFGSTASPDAAANPVIGVIASIAEPPPPPAVTPKPSVHGPVPIGGVVAEANLLHRVQPSYPELAKRARVQGVVEFRAIISKRGDIENLQVVRGHPLLVNAAKEAVLQWRYRPTLLNGQPVEVVTEILVNFTLAQ